MNNKNINNYNKYNNSEQIFTEEEYHEKYLKYKKKYKKLVEHIRNTQTMTQDGGNVKPTNKK
jgi:hypothetical protein